MLPVFGDTLPAQARTLLRLALPIAATQAGFALMGLVDTAVVGRLGAGPKPAVTPQPPVFSRPRLLPARS